MAGPTSSLIICRRSLSRLTCIASTATTETAKETASESTSRVRPRHDLPTASIAGRSEVGLLGDILERELAFELSGAGRPAIYPAEEAVVVGVAHPQAEPHGPLLEEEREDDDQDERVPLPLDLDR